MERKEKMKNIMKNGAQTEILQQIDEEMKIRQNAI